jgi:hypothetical protein
MSDYITIIDELDNVKDLIHTCIDALKDHEAKHIANVLYFSVIAKIEKLQQELKDI